MATVAARHFNALETVPPHAMLGHPSRLSILPLIIRVLFNRHVNTLKSSTTPLHFPRNRPQPSGVKTPEV